MLFLLTNSELPNYLLLFLEKILAEEIFQTVFHGKNLEMGFSISQI